ncbi:MAG: hypothetical protein IIX05_10500, partial [Selenomonadaceae bacterium]|nr:hypothetical protein [Selenomonadaceae bacterium]
MWQKTPCLYRREMNATSAEFGHPTFGLSKGGGEIPWYVHELPVVGISVNKPTMLADAPMLRTYINT